MRIVLKFGGTSLADNSRILAAARRAAQLRTAGAEVVAVVSARGHTTDGILRELEAIHPCPDPREMDMCLATGEQMSAGLMALALQSMGFDAVSLTGWQAGIMTEGIHGDAHVLGLRGDRIRQELRKGRIVVVAGFQGCGENGDITTLGRGGSDTTAVALAAFLRADLCRIYTDVDGVYDKDPRKYPEAKKYDRIGYDEMLTLARHGAQVLHDRCVELAKLHAVPVQVLSSFRPGPGTLVTDVPERFLTESIKDIPNGQ